jgi:hypothetical protein
MELAVAELGEFEIIPVVPSSETAAILALFFAISQSEHQVKQLNNLIPIDHPSALCLLPYSPAWYICFNSLNRRRRAMFTIGDL